MQLLRTVDIFKTSCTCEWKQVLHRSYNWKKQLATASWRHNTWLSVWIRRYRKAQNSRVLDQNEKTERKIKNIIIQLHQVEYKHRGNWEQISCDFVRLFGRSVILYCIKTCLSSRLRVLCYKIFDHDQTDARGKFEEHPESSS